MSSAIVPTFEPVYAEADIIVEHAGDSAPLIDSLDLDALVVHAKNNGSDGSAVHQNSLVWRANRAKSDAGPVVVTGNEVSCSFDLGAPAVGPSDQAERGAGSFRANYCAEIVNPARDNELRNSIVGERCR